MDWAKMDLGLRVITVSCMDLFSVAMNRKFYTTENIVKFDDYSVEELEAIAYSIIPEQLVSLSLEKDVAKIVDKSYEDDQGCASSLVRSLRTLLLQRKQELAARQKRATKAGKSNLMAAAAARASVECSTLEAAIHAS